MVLLCQRHHWLAHKGGWQIVKADDGTLLPVAPMHLFGQARGPD
jgi:hypothetical protein